MIESRRWRQLWFRARTLFGRDQMMADLEEEMELHRRMIADDLARGGMTTREAELAARRRFGNPLALGERSSNEWGFPMVEELRQDVRHGIRLLVRSPLFATVAIITIATGIGVNASAFAFVDTLMLRPLPVAEPGSLVKLLAVNARHTTSLGFAYRDFSAISTRAKSVRDVIAYTAQPSALRIDAGTSAREGSVGGVSSNYFTALGGHAAVGRLIDTTDALAGAAPAITISDALWAGAFQRRPDVVGQSMLVNGERVSIVGVARADFVGINPLVPDVWMPLRLADRLNVIPGRLDDPTNRFLVLHARIRAGFTPAQATAELSPLVTDPPASRGTAAELTRIVGVSLMPSASAIPASAETMVVVLPALFVVGLVLLIASANLGNVLLARALARQREIAIRLAIGASRGRLARQLLTESAVIAVLGSLLGLLLATVVVSLVARFGLSSVPSTYGRLTVDIGLSWRAVAYSAGLSLMSVLTFGLLPALMSSRRDVVAGLKGQDSAFGLDVRKSRVRSVLVAVQVGACVFVLVAVGILVHNLRTMVDAPAGFDREHTIVARFGLVSTGHVPDAVVRDREQLVQRAARTSSVARIAQTSSPPYSAWPTIHAAPAGSDAPLVALSVTKVTPAYFDVIGLSLVDGATFSGRDTATASDVAVISQSTQRRLWASGGAVGQVMRIVGSGSAPDRLVRVIGVVNDARNQSVRESIDGGYIYLPASAEDFATTPMSLVIRINGPEAPAIATLQRMASAIDVAQPLVVTPMQTLAERQVLPFRYVAVSAAAVGAFALVLAMVGLYGVVSFVVAQRRRDIAVHLALGATSKQAMSLVLRELGAVAIGLGTGAVASTALVPILASMTLQLSALPVVQFIAIVGTLAGVAALASALPARAVLRIAPMEVLRED